MKKINNNWIDDNNNSWNCENYSEEQAELLSQTLVNCNNCNNCRDCNNCHYCSYCSGCIDCSYCDDCKNCNNCNNCSSCSHCNNCSSCDDCSYCRGCTHCIDCDDCRSCNNCNDFKTNPKRIISSKIGSRNTQTTIYWTDKNDTRVICGCYKSNLKDFEIRVKNVHKGEYLKQYLGFIKVVKYNIKNL